MTRTKYQQLQPEERIRIEIWQAENVSLRVGIRSLQVTSVEVAASPATY